MTKKCNECGDLITGRSDKKFCSDMCRNAHHNKFNGYRNALIRHVNHKLRKNRFILFELSKGKAKEFSRDELIYHGYDWQFFTEELVLTEHTHRFCYDFGVEFDADNRVRIITKQYNKKNRKPKLMPMAAED
ncbi:MAG: hypothetical protein KA347_02555 [Bacteroidia bacterium]|jgi:hypothetical protein|nr:hypothetical protein [Bacteroidia bacterium]